MSTDLIRLLYEQADAVDDARTSNLLRSAANELRLCHSTNARTREIVAKIREQMQIRNKLGYDEMSMEGVVRMIERAYPESFKEQVEG